ncbi:hypothetical protein KYC5002_15150 [Archangium violaceum]|uniref:hypothetical protein n=1 Tax=Archangium violaceum TaxID=83451 RepID=UPI002B31FDE8|nr:hypothetical protein KYC5002_15150 [Archangium gephyra]
MTKKRMMVVAVFLAGVLGGGTAALAFAGPTAPCPVDFTCRDERGRCIPCPEW